MLKLTISAVSSSLDELTITAHGLNTGDGPGAIYTSTGTIPGGLAGATDYYAIKIDANTIKLASSSANALAGTAIDITSTGSGTLYLLLGIPARRATTYGVGSQLKSADLNATQDTFVALWNFFTGQSQSVWSYAPQTLGIGPLGWAPTTGTPAVTIGSGDVPYISAASGAWAVLLPLVGIPPGATISDVQVFYDRNGGAISGGSLNYRDPSDTTSHTVLANMPTDSTSTGLQSISLAGVGGSILPYAYAGAAALHLELSSSSNLTKFYGVKVTYTRGV